MKKTPLKRKTALKTTGKLNKVRKTTAGAKTRTADKNFSIKVRSIGICELKGKDKINCGGNLQCMHIITRTNRRLRWDLMNAISGCAGHHRYYTTHPFEFYEIIKKHFPNKYAYVSEHRHELWNGEYERTQ